MKTPLNPGRLLRLFSSSIASQAILSAANFICGVMMLRHSTDADYGVYVLATSALFLVTGVQGALIIGPLSVLAPKKTPDERLRMAGTLLWTPYQIWIPATLVALTGFLGARLLGLLPDLNDTVGIVCCVVALCYLSREYLRQLFFIFSAPYLVLAIDVIFAVFQVSLVAYAAVYFEPSTPYAIAGLGLASLAASLAAWLLFRRRWGWQAGYPNALQELWRLGKWGVAGCIITWLHTQGFYYLLAGIEGTALVAAVAAARLLLMPINLMLAGVGQMLLPMASRWLHEEGIKILVRRLLLIVLLILTAACAYFGVLWMLRHWIVTDILRRETANLDPLLLIWGAVFAVMILRAIAMVVLQVQEKFAVLAYVSVLTATLSLLVAWWGITNFGVLGSVWGIVAGELLDLIAIVWLICRNYRASALLVPNGKRS